MTTTTLPTHRVHIVREDGTEQLIWSGSEQQCLDDFIGWCRNHTGMLQLVRFERTAGQEVPIRTVVREHV